MTPSDAHGSLIWIFIRVSWGAPVTQYEFTLSHRWAVICVITTLTWSDVWGHAQVTHSYNFALEFYIVADKLFYHFYYIFYIYIYIYAFSRRFYPKCIQVIHFYVCSLGMEPTTFCAADAMLYHWATQEHFISMFVLILGCIVRS